MYAFPTSCLRVGGNGNEKVHAYNISHEKTGDTTCRIFPITPQTSIFSFFQTAHSVLVLCKHINTVDLVFPGVRLSSATPTHKHTCLPPLFAIAVATHSHYLGTCHSRSSSDSFFRLREIRYISVPYTLPTASHVGAAHPCTQCGMYRVSATRRCRSRLSDLEDKEVYTFLSYR